MAICLVASLVAGCEQAPSKLDQVPGPTPAKPAERMAGSAGVRNPHSAGSGMGMGSGSAKPPEPAMDIDSKDILGRTDAAEEVVVKHVLLAWADLAPIYRGRMDPRASKRNN